MPKILAGKLKSNAFKARPPVIRKGPLWAGPCAEGPLGGITFSMLSSFLVCRERFRLKYVEGLRPAQRFSHALEYGNLWHTCEEAHAAGVEWGTALQKYAQTLLTKYPLQRADVDKWYKVCRAQFPIYVDYWSKHKDVQERTPLMQEQVFDVSYSLPSGRVVRLRGKFDAVDLIGKGKMAGVYLFENKTKGEVDVEQIQKQLSFDLQTMLYLTALDMMDAYEGLSNCATLGESLATKEVCNKHQPKPPQGTQCAMPIRGVRYNVVRRPLSGGKGTIKQKEGSKNVKPETEDEYYKRLQQYFIEEPELFFLRWKADVSPHEVRMFKERCLDPLLEQLCAWYEVVTGTSDGVGIVSNPFVITANGIPLHWQHPYGVTNSVNEGYDSDTDNLLATGSDVGLVRHDKLFEELQ